LQAVRFWLPRKHQSDIVRELSDDISSEIEEKESLLGRPLEESEVVEILKRHGNPFLAASKYLPAGDWGASPWLLLYRFAMKVVLLWILAPVLAVVFLPRIAFSKNPALALLDSWSSIWLAVIYAVGSVTVGFAIARWANPKPVFFENWDPLRMPPVRDPLRISRFSSVVEVVAALMVLAWWISPEVKIVDFALQAKSGWVVPSIWTTLYGTFHWPITATLVAGMAVSGLNFFMPRWTRPRLAVKAASDAATSLIAISALLMNRSVLLDQFQVMHNAHRFPQGQVASAAVNIFGLAISLGIVAIICSGTALAGFLKMQRLADDSLQSPLAPSGQLSAGKG
jgi:hypothetical protein